jgi:hypothetical protein
VHHDLHKKHEQRRKGLSTAHCLITALVVGHLALWCGCKAPPTPPAKSAQSWPPPATRLTWELYPPTPPAKSAQSGAFRLYDYRFIKTVENRWYEVLDQSDEIQHEIQQGRQLPAGKVVLRFLLHDDGTVSDLTVIENTTNSDLAADLCLKAVRNPPLFEHWSPEMLKLVGKPYREMTFAFDYHH